jgi:serine protease Do
VVGINVAIFSTSGGYEGVGFAIPVNNAKRIISKLKEGKKILYGWLGVTVQDLTDDLAKYFGLPDKNGVLVAKVLENGPAQKAGMKESDVIKQFDNKPVNNVKELLSAVAKAEVGRKIKIAVVRDKKELTLEVQIGARPENLEEETASVVSTENWRGLEVEEIGPENAQRFRLEEKKGVVVVDVGPDTPADEAGMIAGDVILEINKQTVANISDYEKVTKGLKGNALIKTSRGYFLVKGEE